MGLQLNKNQYKIMQQRVAVTHKEEIEKRSREDFENVGLEARTEAMVKVTRQRKGRRYICH